MASEVDICNLALAHLGDEATVASLSPPEGSAQAEHAARFYPIARDGLLEMHAWSFASKRSNLALLTSSIAQWQYAYAAPADMMSAISILDPNSQTDYTTPFFDSNNPFTNGIINAGMYAPRPYAIETLASGDLAILTDQEDALLRYQARITDTTKYSPLFITALSWHLASYLAGPVIKGDAGQAEAKRCSQMMAAFLLQATASDSKQREIKVEHIVPWTSGR